MLPKVDKNKKTFPQDQLSEKENERLKKEKHVKKKRRLVLFSLIFTVGLSFIFWTYRTTKNFIDQGEKLSVKFNISLPKFDFSREKSHDFDHQMERIISSECKDISLYITDDNPDHPFIWQKNKDLILLNNDLSSIKEKVNSIQPTTQSSMNLNLPQGLTFQEISYNQGSHQHFLQINLPGRNLLILISASQQQDCSKLIESIYWNYLDSLN